MRDASQAQPRRRHAGDASKRSREGEAITYAPNDMMIVAAARALPDGARVLVGIGQPSTAANLARRVHAPNLVLIYESGAIGAKPSHLPLSIGDGILGDTADVVVGVAEMFSYWLQAGRIDIGFLSAAQIDRFANINTTVIGEYGQPHVRLPGAGGAPAIAASCRDTIVVAEHEPRRFVSAVDFVTSVGARNFPGNGPTLVITDLGEMRPAPGTGELVLTAVHSGVEPRHVRAMTGWDLQVAPDLVVNAPPTSSELSALRHLESPTAAQDDSIDRVRMGAEGDM